jgi:hypothetical protein
MKQIFIITLLLITTGCSTIDSKPKEKEIIGLDIIQEGGNYFGQHFGKNGYQYCKYISNFGNTILLKKEHYQVCSKK